MKRMSVWCLALLAVLLLVGLVQAAPYVQGELGVNFGTASGAKINGVTAPQPYPEYWPVGRSASRV